MATENTVESRLTMLEEEVAKLRAEVVEKQKAGWLRHFIGIFADEPAFDEVIRYGREFRYADRPPDLDKEAS